MHAPILRRTHVRAEVRGPNLHARPHLPPRVRFATCACTSQLGHTVHAIDFSEEGLKKTKLLAEALGVAHRVVCVKVWGVGCVKVWDEACVMMRVLNNDVDVAGYPTIIDIPLKGALPASPRLHAIPWHLAAPYIQYLDASMLKPPRSSSSNASGVAAHLQWQHLKCCRKALVDCLFRSDKSTPLTLPPPLTSAHPTHNSASTPT
eukprot:353770-Chlamydomonas_euryale.AAC.1